MEFLIQKNNTKTENKGFTLIELMVAMAVFSMVLSVIYFAYQFQMKSYITTKQKIEMQQNLRGTLQLMVEELRLAGLDPTGKTGAGIIEASSNNIKFSMDYTRPEAGDGEDDNSNGLTDEPEESGFDGVLSTEVGEEIEYAYFPNTGELHRTSPHDGMLHKLLFNVEALQFQYFNAQGTAIDFDAAGKISGNIGQIRSMRIDLTGKPDSSVLSYNRNDSQRSISMTHHVVFRNL